MRRLLITIALVTTVLVIFHSADWLQTSSFSAVRMSMRNRHQLHYTPGQAAPVIERAPMQGSTSVESPRAQHSTDTTRSSSQPAAAGAPPHETSPARPSHSLRYMDPDRTALVYNNASRAALAPHDPRGSTLHFTFGSAVMMDFVKKYR